MAIVRSQEASSSSTFRHNYQVFLSFRGEDTRKTFTDHLYTALDQAGFRTFRDDDEIERGKKLELELRKAIQQSRISIIVFSKNYASSKWCLDEVVMILEWSWSRSRSSGYEVLPVFYDVDPSDVRNQTGSIGEAFARHEKEYVEIDDGKKKEWMEKVKSWKLALREVANLTGLVLQNQANGHEAKFIQKIVNVVESKLNREILYVGRHLVGMHYRVKNIDSWVQSSSSSEDILVIWGMGGIGKTTIAKCVYNSNFQNFEGSCLLASVKVKSQQPNGLVNLQAQLLSSILKGKRKEIYDVDDGINKINEVIGCKKVLVVIDDVDEVEELDALLGTREFYPGSKIIITTRNKSLLKAHEVHRLYTVEKLDDHESLELFCWHAFGKEHPIECYLEQSKRAVYHCGGLPLAHRILGSSLAGKSTEVWASTLEKLDVIPEIKILNVLKISFDSLQDDHDRNLFLHIACFFVGHEKYETIEILNACDFFTVCGIQNLIDRCLISIDANKLMMHQLLQEMGRQIVDRESPNEPEKRSRLWRLEDSFIVVEKKKGTKTIEGLVLDMQMYKDDDCNVREGKKHPSGEFFSTSLSSNLGSSLRRRYFNFISSEPSIDVDFNYDAFSRMERLKLLKLNYTKLSGHCDMFPEGLRWLCWHGFPLKYIPYDLPLVNIVSLDMSYSKLEYVWTVNKVLLSLKIFNLSHSQRLIKTPDFRGLPNLERLILEGCVSLVDVSDTIENLERLDSLNLKNCKSLRKFPNIGMLKSLQTLVFDGCSNIREFAMQWKNMESLKVLNANGVTTNPLTSTPKDHVKQWNTSFQPWDVSQPILKNPQHIRVSFPCSLVSLSLQKCDLSDDDFPLDFSNLSMLNKLDLSYNHFLNLPRCVGSLPMLSWLDLTSCNKLHSISGLPNLNVLQVSECISLESVEYQSALSRPVTISHGCGKLKEIQDVFKLEPMKKVNREILDSLGLRDVELMGNLGLAFCNSSAFVIKENIRQGLYEFGIFSTFLRGEEIPSWCGDRNNNKSSSSSVSFVVPSHPTSLRIRGLNVYSVYTRSKRFMDIEPSLLFIKINNKSKDLKWIYSPVARAIPGESKVEEKEFVWLSHWKFGNHLESGDEVEVFVILSCYSSKVKEIGISFEWAAGEEKGEEHIKATPHDNNMREVIGGDLSNYQLIMSPRTFFLCHYYFVIPFEQENSWFRELFGDHVPSEDILRWHRTSGRARLLFQWGLALTYTILFKFSAQKSRLLSTYGDGGPNSFGLGDLGMAALVRLLAGFDMESLQKCCCGTGGDRLQLRFCKVLWSSGSSSMCRPQSTNQLGRSSFHTSGIKADGKLDHQ